MPKTFARLLGVVLCLFSAMAIAQEEFSADIYSSQGGKDISQMAKVYMSKNKLRFDGHDQAAHHGAVIMNLDSGTMDILMAEQKMYIETAPGQSPVTRNYNFFRTGDVENACADWQKMAVDHKGTCKKDGDEVVNGRKTVKYEGVSSTGKTSYVWLDSSLRFPVKWQEERSSGELRNIQVGSQPASLFEIPSDYQKMQMPAGMPSTMQHP